MKLRIIKAATMFALFTLSSSLMAATDSGTVTFRGQIVEGDEPCKIVHQNNDQAVEISSAKSTKFSLKINRCADETLNSISASFNENGEGAMIIKNSQGKSMNETPRTLLLSHNSTVDFTVNANHLHHRSGISQLMLSYE